MPHASLSTDIIVGFCGETYQQFLETCEIMEKVKFNQAFIYAYSMREKTYAHRKLIDDVSQSEKISRLNQINKIYIEGTKEKNKNLVGSK